MFIQYRFTAQLTDLFKDEYNISTTLQVHTSFVFLYATLKTKTEFYRNSRCIARGVEHTKYTGRLNTKVRVTMISKA